MSYVQMVDQKRDDPQEGKEVLPLEKRQNTGRKAVYDQCKQISCSFHPSIFHFDVDSEDMIDVWEEVMSTE